MVTIAIIGVGLIGGSMALKLRQKGAVQHVIGCDKNQEHLRKALELHIIDEALPLKGAVANASMIILATPVDIIASLLPDVMQYVTGQVVTEVGSAQQKIIQTIACYRNKGRFVAAHPMWGTEYSGPEAATTDSFEGKAVVFCNEDTADPDAVQKVREMYDVLGMFPISMDAGRHDESVAYVSHISHITSFALANTVLEKEKEVKSIFDLASGGFESTVRLGKSSAEMWVPVFKQNRENILDVLREHIRQLEMFEQALEHEDWQELTRFVRDANKIKRILNKGE